MASLKTTPPGPAPLALCPRCAGPSVKNAHTQYGSLHEMYCTCANAHSFAVRWTDAA